MPVYLDEGGSMPTSKALSFFSVELRPLVARIAKCKTPGLTLAALDGGYSDPCE